jgi:O-antigen ligase
VNGDYDTSRVRSAWLPFSFLFLAPLAFGRGLYDPSELVQRAFVGCGALLLVTLWLLGRDAVRIVPRRSLDAPVLALVAWSAASLLWSANRYQAFTSCSRWAAAGLVYLLVSRRMTEPAAVRLVLLGPAAAAGAASALGLAQALLDFAWVPQVVAPAATFANKNLAAQFVVIALPVAAALFVSARSRIADWSLAVVLALGGAYLVHATTRSAWLAAAMAAGSCLLAATPHAGPLLRRLRGGAKPLAAASGLLLMLSLSTGRESPPAPVPGGAVAASEAMASRGAESVRIRLLVWRDTLVMIGRAPWLGVGAGNHGVKYALFAAPDDPLDARLLPEAVHNDYLQLAAELGIVGIGLLLWLARRTLHALRAAAASAAPDDRRILALGIFASLVALATEACFSFPLQRAIPPLLAGAWLGVLASWEPRAAARSAELAAGWRKAAGLLAGAATVAALAFCGRLLGADAHVYDMVRAERQRDWPAVVRHAEAAVSKDPFRTAPLFGKATAELRLGDPGAAAASLERLLRSEPHYVNAIGNLGAAYLALGRTSDARVCFERVLELRPRDALALRGRELVREAERGAGRVEARPATAWSPATCSTGVDVRVGADGRVSLSARSAPVRAVLDCLAEHTGMKVVYESGTSHRVSLSVEDQLLPAVIAKVLEGSGVNYALTTDRTGVKVELLLVSASAAASTRAGGASSSGSTTGSPASSDAGGQSPAAAGPAGAADAPRRGPAGQPFFVPGAPSAGAPAGPGAAPLQPEPRPLTLSQLRDP